MPRIISVTVKGHPPKGSPMDVAEIARLYAVSAPHLQAFIRWALGTGEVGGDHPVARGTGGLGTPGRSLEPEGREQNKKHRPVVKLPAILAGEVVGSS